MEFSSQSFAASTTINTAVFQLVAFTLMFAVARKYFVVSQTFQKLDQEKTVAIAPEAVIDLIELLENFLELQIKIFFSRFHSLLGTQCGFVFSTLYRSTRQVFESFPGLPDVTGNVSPSETSQLEGGDAVSQSSSERPLVEEDPFLRRLRSGKVYSTKSRSMEDPVIGKKSTLIKDSKSQVTFKDPLTSTLGPPSTIDWFGHALLQRREDKVPEDVQKYSRSRSLIRASSPPKSLLELKKMGFFSRNSPPPQ